MFKDTAEAQRLGIGMLLTLIWANTLFVVVDVEMYFYTFVSSVVLALCAVVCLVIPDKLLK